MIKQMRCFFFFLLLSLFITFNSSCIEVRQKIRMTPEGHLKTLLTIQSGFENKKILQHPLYSRMIKNIARKSPVHIRKNSSGNILIHEFEYSSAAGNWNLWSDIPYNPRIINSNRLLIPFPDIQKLGKEYPDILSEKEQGGHSMYRLVIENPPSEIETILFFGRPDLEIPEIRSFSDRIEMKFPHSRYLDATNKCFIEIVFRKVR